MQSKPKGVWIVTAKEDGTWEARSYEPPVSVELSADKGNRKVYRRPRLVVTFVGLLYRRVVKPMRHWFSKN